ncbi:flagellar biosynthetic protein FliR [Flintibacter muris]|uniref:flagellar biosynthetic protein FliR n=1 Tax=Flintibacter muris TaxID=2941327 RepID=UPI00203E3D6F|nr:flagellar biosynthetic protein FliR [Flintibacter muris]
MDWTSLTLFLLITGRMTGFVVFNPLLGRRGIPNMIKAGFILLLSICVFSMSPAQVQVPSTLLGLAFTFLLELFLGYALGLIVNIFFYIPIMAGSVIDMQMGLSMASTYDPASGIQVTATSTLLNALMSLLFFAANGHHTLIRIFANSSLVIPFGGVALGDNFYAAMIQIFIDCTILGVKLSMPILAAELMGQVGMGILMKVIPQINVFVINIDLKVIIGLVLVMLLLAPFSDYLLDAETEMLLTLQHILPLMSG